ncbi:MAG: class I SAM-dependent methyltransferase [Candidatus Acidiferrum sp.]
MTNSAVAGQLDRPYSVPRHVSVEEGYARWARTYDETPNPLLALEQRCLLPLLPCITGKRVLDLACGTGRWLEQLSALGPSLGIGIDLSAAMLAVAREKDAIAGRLAKADCRTLPFGNSTFNLAVCSFALEHIANLGELALEWSRVLQQPADLYVTELHPRAYAAGWRTGFRDQQGAMQINAAPHSATEMITAFSGAGFELLGVLECFVGEPERPLFARTGKERSFDAVCVVPAILMLHFRRHSSAAEN